MDDLHKVRELYSERPLRRIWANVDGRVFFATAEPKTQVLVLDGATLWLKQTIEFPRMNVDSVSVVP